MLSLPVSVCPCVYMCGCELCVCVGGGTSIPYLGSIPMWPCPVRTLFVSVGVCLWVLVSPT